MLENNNGTFRDVTDKVAPSLTKPGLVTSALWSDYNNNGQLDLMLTGEWMPLMVYQNKGNELVDVTEQVGLDSTHGWWNTIAAGDFDDDGHTDYVAGNHGLNSYFKASKDEPVFLYAGDFDSTGRIEPVLFHYIKGEISPYPHRDLFCSTMPEYFNKFITYEDYAKASLNDIIPPEQQKKAVHLEAYQLASCLIDNQGQKGFKVEELPVQAQFAPLYSFAFQDFNQDNRKDLIVGGNSYSNHYKLGNMEALGVIPLRGKDDGSFSSTGKFQATGFEQINGDVKAVQSIQTQTSMDNGKILLVAQSDGPLEIFRSVPSLDKLEQ
ncbi:MAG: hypothetical protein BRD50_07985 [Bacteroidetes bacterium SW_11_45_7]|nr:MAG: hypothetical protein BRD50_07985 [Bacteroidetes bacterium SW_11_45_7]